MTEKQREMIERIKTLRSDAYLTDDKSCTRGKYEWEIGTDVICELKAMNPYDYVETKPDETLMLMGYPVRVNYENTCVIKLWAEVR